MEFKKLGCSSKAIQELNKLYLPEGKLKSGAVKKPITEKLAEDLKLLSSEIFEISKSLEAIESLPESVKNSLEVSKNLVTKITNRINRRSNKNA